MGNRIVIMAGGTGGHVFPALAVAQHLIDEGWQVSWMGTRQGLESRVVPENHIEIDWLTVAGLRGKGAFAKMKAPIMLLRACMQSLAIMRKRKPDVVLGMGGFVAGPGGLISRLLSIPLVIHEQNRIPGTTNRLLSRFANVVMEAFPESFEPDKEAVFTGNPLRKEFIGKRGKKNSDRLRNLRLLVVGGSLGAKVLNEMVPSSAATIPNIEVRHQTGKTMREEVCESYRKSGVKADVVEFIEDMVAAYQWADLVICRAGAMTVSELAAMGLPAILIPFPYAIDDHQTANARYLTDSGAGILIDQKELNAETLAKQIGFIAENLPEMSKAALSCSKLDATESVANICIAEAGK